MTVRHIEETHRRQKQKPRATELVFILDCSGSMAGMGSDVIGGFNAMLEKQQKKPGRCRVTTVLFDTGYRLLHESIDIQDMRPMTDRDFEAGGCTALYDAVGRTIRRIAEIQKQTAPKGRADHVVFAIMTDGLENASKRYTLPQIRSMIEREQTAYGWEFLFLGANFDAEATAETMGIRKDHAVEYLADSQGMQVSFQAMSESLESVRDCGMLDTRCMQSVREDTRTRSRVHRRNRH